MTSVKGEALVPGIAEAICGLILQGSLREGEVIHQTDIARSLGVSPVPVREALRRLEAEGLVTFLPYRGTIVTPMTKSEICEIFDAGLALGEITILAALPFFKAADFEALEGLAGRLDGGGGTMQDLLDFYDILSAPARMPLIQDMIRRVVMRGVRLFDLTQANREALQHVHPTRLELVQACRSGDAQVVKKVLVDYHHVRRDGLLQAFTQRTRRP
ncbi:MAG: GntR family transcriptional regulator [Acidobacteria bacterium]|nr:GntR family transcriptional regulator [Acidobacteriota bacterium]